jgi:Holliday junction resolvase RusA-like endonuclease
MTTELLAELRVRMVPRPAPRPRFARSGHPYNEGWYGAYLEELAWELRRCRKGPPHLGPVGVDVLFCRQDARKGDLDNYTKGLYDAANGIIWADDFQVRQSRQRLELRAAEPLIWARFVALVPAGARR